MFTTGANGKTILLVAISKHATVTPAVKEKAFTVAVEREKTVTPVRK